MSRSCGANRPIDGRGESDDARGIDSGGAECCIKSDSGSAGLEPQEQQDRSQGKPSQEHREVEDDFLPPPTDDSGQCQKDTRQEKANRSCDLPFARLRERTFDMTKRGQLTSGNVWYALRKDMAIVNGSSAQRGSQGTDHIAGQEGNRSGAREGEGAERDINGKGEDQGDGGRDDGDGPGGIVIGLNEVHLSVPN